MTGYIAETVLNIGADTSVYLCCPTYVIIFEYNFWRLIIVTEATLHKLPLVTTTSVPPSFLAQPSWNSLIRLQI